MKIAKRGVRRLTQDRQTKCAAVRLRCQTTLGTRTQKLDLQFAELAGYLGRPEPCGASEQLGPVGDHFFNFHLRNHRVEPQPRAPPVCVLLGVTAQYGHKAMPPPKPSSCASRFALRRANALEPLQGLQIWVHQQSTEK